jgi:transketolase N-terminal domain/subunit
MSTKFEFRGWPLDEVDDDAIEAIEQAIQDLAQPRDRWNAAVFV